MRIPRTAVSALVVVLLLAGCTGVGATASPPPTTASPSQPAVTPTPVPVPSDAGGGSGGNPGGGAVDPGGGGGAPAGGDPDLVTPVAGLVDIHDVAVSELRSSIDGRHVSVLVAWWSGVEPCNVLAGVEVARDGTTFTLTVREGSQGRGVACIEIAKYKGTIVDLGELEPGTYTVVGAGGQAAPIEVVVA